MRGGTPIGVGKKRLAFLLLLNLYLLPMVAMVQIVNPVPRMNDDGAIGEGCCLDVVLDAAGPCCMKMGSCAKTAAGATGRYMGKACKAVDEHVQMVVPKPYKNLLYGAGLLFLGYLALRPKRIIVIETTPASSAKPETSTDAADNKDVLIPDRIATNVSEVEDKIEETSSEKTKMNLPNLYVIVGCILAGLIVIGGVGVILCYRRKDGHGNVKSKKVTGKGRTKKSSTTKTKKGSRTSRIVSPRAKSSIPSSTTEGGAAKAKKSPKASKVVSSTGSSPRTTDGAKSSISSGTTDGATVKVKKENVKKSPKASRIVSSTGTSPPGKGGVKSSIPFGATDGAVKAKKENVKKSPKASKIVSSAGTSPRTKNGARPS